ncbi:FecR family protein [Pseudobacter ginsenosidimutans]|uniref:FecR family protein n=1 Tax=Pseudobacter ginsenosidimutans TaxID=661488 RepID=A0A4V2F2A4_9BACT|nr:FecR family protein [Pseudobacter ginsenosidimutans]QEC45091.1 FecR family protein [Pseudobacter ginsenosidimutans]RZS76587.1 FecR family protein [Pseudobacter ginsenosidimutans]
MIDKKLIEKFLRGECPEDEAAGVLQYLRQHPSVLEEFLPEEEWEKYVSVPATTVDEELYGNIQESIRSGKRKRTMLISLFGAAAAILLFFGIRYISQDNKVAGETELAANSTTETIRKNSTAAAQQITLPDHSIITLSAGSEIRYASDYNVSNRHIYLTGKAEFSVAKDKEKQFTVFCGKVATTALGTRFSVDGNAKTISVVLYEGKVVVKKVKDETIANYLLPGDQISFNIRKEIFEKFRNEGLAAAKSSPKTEMEKGTTVNTRPADAKASQIETGPDENSGHINFQNQNLKKVLDQLAERYNVEIDYPTEISSSINIFISVDTTQTIDKILRNIAAINNLEVKKIADKKFYISK